MSEPTIEKGDQTIQSTTLEANHILHVTVADPSGQTALASFDLDSIVGVVNGALSLGATNFSQSARNVTLADDNQVLDAEVPDANGDYSTSSVSIAHTVAKYNGQDSLLFAIGLPHSTVHADADTVEEADAKIKSQAQTTDGNTSVDEVLTTHIHPSYDMNNPNHAVVSLLQQNLGPFGGGSSTSKSNSSSNANVGLKLLHKECIVM